MIGYGYWGPNLVRNFWEADASQVEAVSDLNEGRLLAAKNRYPSLHTTIDHTELIANPEIDAIAVATPVATRTLDLAGRGFAGEPGLISPPTARI